MKDVFLKLVFNIQKNCINFKKIYHYYLRDKKHCSLTYYLNFGNFKKDKTKTH